MQFEEELKYPQMRTAEDPTHILTVNESEIKSERIQTEEEKEAARIKAAEAAARSAEAEAGERALQDMMHGTLEGKKDTGILEDLVRPDWMDEIPENMMSDEQKAAVATFDKEQRAIEEAREQRHRLLETELKKIKGETADIVKNFDDNVKALFAMYLSVKKLNYRDESCILSLVNNLAEAEQLDQISRLFTKCLMDLEQEKKVREETAGKFFPLLEAARAEKEKLSVELQFQDKNFKREFVDCGCNVDHLYKLFKAKGIKSGSKEDAKPEVNLDSDDEVEDQQETESEKEKKQEEENKADPFYFPESADDDKYLELDSSEMPDGCEEEAWAKVQEKRLARLSKESVLKAQGALVVEMTKRLQHLSDQVSAVSAQIRAVQEQKSNFESSRQRIMLNVDVMMKLDQGLAEIEESPVVTDLQNCEMVQRENVEKLNKSILKLGNDNVAVLKEMMKFRKGITALHWERKRLGLTHQDAEDLTKELQLLRVTKNLQVLIKAGGHDSKAAAEITLLERKFEHLRQITIQELASRKKKLAAFRVKVRHQSMENSRLGKTVTKLEGLVAERVAISKIKDESGLGNQTVGEGVTTGLTAVQEQKMEYIAERRQLLNIADAQKHELQKLIAERDRLRGATFPSFVSQNRRFEYPDEKPSNSRGFRLTGSVSGGMSRGSQTARFGSSSRFNFGGPVPPSGAKTSRAGGRSGPRVGVFLANPAENAQR
mmetsp:Transcript_49008/g.96107  ORF Transcript_49008/g.96107 Transcript_49008/m.96107 type:complete len:717 (+) Transcript_49008:2037-4187(+)